MLLSLDGSNIGCFGVGTKAANLSLLSSSFNVPAGFCITNRVFKSIVRCAGVLDFNKEINAFDPGDFKSIEKISIKIRKRILTCKLQGSFVKDLKMFLDKLGKGPFAVRSSSVLEDKQKSSFAGQLDSYLNRRNFKDVEKSVKKCLASFYNSRAIAYRIKRNIVELEPRMSVVIQKMIQPVFSGVTFTKSPNEPSYIHIEAVSGLGANLVSGKSSPNSYDLDRASFTLRKNKENFQVDGRIVESIAKTALAIEKFFGQPQDIEWCVDKDMKIWVVQARPITA